MPMLEFKDGTREYLPYQNRAADFQRILEERLGSDAVNTYLEIMGEYDLKEYKMLVENTIVLIIANLETIERQAELLETESNQAQLSVLLKNLKSMRTELEALADVNAEN